MPQVVKPAQEGRKSPAPPVVHPGFPGTARSGARRSRKRHPARCPPLAPWAQAGPVQANAIASWSLAKSSPYRPNRATRSHPSSRNENARDQSPPPSSEMSRALPWYRSSRNPAACTSRTRPPATSQPQGQALPATVTEPHRHHALSHQHEHKTLAAAAGSASPFPSERGGVGLARAGRGLAPQAAGAHAATPPAVTLGDQAIAARTTRHSGRVTGNKIMRFLIMRGINVRFVSVRRVSVSAWQKGQ